MERSRLAIDSQATEAVFAKYGGAEQWQELSMSRRLPVQEQKQIDDICLAMLMTANENRLLLDSEQTDVYRAIEEGLNLGLNILAYNFMKGDGEVTPAYYQYSLGYYADKCASYIKGVEARWQGGTEPQESPEAPGIEHEEDIDGFMRLIDEQVDKFCPKVEHQYDFRFGAKMAEQVFLAALLLAERAEQIKIDDEFEKLMTDSDIEFEI